MAQYRLRKILICATAVMTATASTPLAPAIAQNGRILDGEPTAANCANLGFAAPGMQENARMHMGSSGAVQQIPMPPAVARVPPAYVPMPPVALPSPAAPAPTRDRALRMEGPPPIQARPAPPPPPPPPPPMAMPMPMPQQPAPYAVGAPEAYPDAQPNPIRQAATEPVSTFSIDVDTAAYSNVRRFLNDGQRPPTDAVRVEELINYFDYAYPRPASRQTPFRPTVAVAPSPWAEGKEVIHIGIQGFAPPRGEEPPLNLVFLVDTSGSMYGPDRLPLAQRSLNVLIDQLRPQDTVAMVAYAGSAGAVLAPTPGREKLKMRCAVNALTAGGSTAGGAGLTLAYALAEQNFDEEAVNRVILMTDGDFNVGVTDNRRLEDYIDAKRESGVYLSVYGFGRGNYQDARMQTLAQNGNGAAAYVDSLEEARKLFRDDFTASMFPIADDVKIQVEFNPAVVAEYRLIGYETRMLRREDFNNDAVDAGEVGAGASVTALYEVTRVGGPVAIDPLRYGRVEPAERGAGELAFLRIRYKRPGEGTSQLIEQPIDARSAYARLADAPEATRWAVAVAAYGQKLRRDDYVSRGYGWDETLALAQGARGADDFGLRAEFIRLLRAAQEVESRQAGL